MESRNPVFNSNKEFQRGGYATFRSDGPSVADLEGMYRAPSATSAQTGRMTLDDVVVRTASLFGVLLVTAGATYLVVKPALLPVLGAMLVGLVLALVAQFNRRPRPVVMLAYAAFEGVFIGGISYWYSLAYGNDLVPQAVLGTLAAFGAMLALYTTGIIRNSPKFTRGLLIAGVGYLAFGLLNLLLAGFHVGGYHSVYSGGGLLAIAISGFGVALASLFLVLDFDYVEQGIRNGLPREYAWTAAFGLIVTLVWLYLEILRLLAILRGND
ncbi:MAG TPA: Bax inhibitor-1/YccA family protein [Kineosporiaceae bacterium]